MLRRPPRSTRTDTLFPYTTLFRSGRTCHAAIIARELGIPAVVGCANATDVLSNGKEVTVSCAEGDEGRIYEGLIETEIEEVRWGEMPEIGLKKIGRAHV